MKYDEMTCYWCGESVENQKAFYSLRTDTFRTRRNFCSEKHLKEFKKHAKKSNSGFLTLPPYRGK